MTDTTNAGPIGPPNPTATSTPPRTSVKLAAAAKSRPGRKPSCSKNAPVPVRPYPPNQPKSFCDPCAAISTPNTNRTSKSPIAMVSPSQFTPTTWLHCKIYLDIKLYDINILVVKHDREPDTGDSVQVRSHDATEN